MKGFEPVTLHWRGEAYTVPADRQLRMIAEIEDSISNSKGIPAILLLLERRVDMARLAMAYGVALRYAGANVTDEEIHLSITADIADGSAAAAIKMEMAVLGLLDIIAPPVAKAVTKDTDFDMEKPSPADGSEPSTASSSETDG